MIRQIDEGILWDNWPVTLRVRRCDDRFPRDLRRTTTAGHAPTVAQVS